MNAISPSWEGETEEVGCKPSGKFHVAVGLHALADARTFCSNIIFRAATLHHWLSMNPLNASSPQLIQQCALFPSNHPFLGIATEVLSHRINTRQQDASLSSEESSAALASEGAEEEEGVTAESDTSNPLAGLDSDAMACEVQSILNEQSNKGLYHKFKKAAEEWGAEGLWDLLLQTNEKIRNKDPITTDANGKPRTSGGVFLNLLKQGDAAASKRKREPELEPFLVEVSRPLRPYQEQAVRAMQQDINQNWVVSGPTGSGKTALFVKVAKDLIDATPQAKVVVIVPTIPLAQQQALAFQRGAGFSPPNGGARPGCPIVDYFYGDKPFPGRGAWLFELQALSVMVFEANTFKNLLLPQGVSPPRASMDDVDLLVLDECHHTDKQHPYTQIMDFYQAAAKKPQVLGFSASPANGPTKSAVSDAMLRLLAVLGQAKLYVMHEDDESVKQYVPSPKEDVHVLRPRGADQAASGFLRQLMLQLAEDLGKALLQQADSTGVSTYEKVWAFVATLPAQEAARNPVQAHNLLCRWMRKAILLASEWHLIHFGLGIELLEDLRMDAALCDDMGYECGLRSLIEHLVMKALKVQKKKGPTARAHASSSHMPRDTAHGNDPLADLRTHLHSAPSAEQKQAEMNAASRRAQSAGVWHGVQPCADILEACVMKSIKSVLTELQFWADAQGPRTFACTSGTGTDCFVEALARPFQPGGLHNPPKTFPKLHELVAYLQRYKDAQELHAIIFTQTRQGAHHLARALESAMQPSTSTGASASAGSSSSSSGAAGEKLWLRPAKVDVLVGHQGASQVNKGRQLPYDMVAAGAALDDDDTTAFMQQREGHGMTGAQQKAVLDAFRESGRKLLVATTAAEEGLDVPSCELVIRFSPTATGTQRIQARGRGRKEDARYVCLLQSGYIGGGSDLALHKKSKQEESAQRTFLRGGVQPI